MFQAHSALIPTVIALGVFVVFWGGAWAGEELKVGAAEALEVRVLEVQAPPTPAQGERFAVFYRTEVISVLRSAS